MAVADSAAGAPTSYFDVIETQRHISHLHTTSPEEVVHLNKGKFVTKLLLTPVTGEHFQANLCLKPARFVQCLRVARYFSVPDGWERRIARYGGRIGVNIGSVEAVGLVFPVDPTNSKMADCHHSRTAFERTTLPWFDIQKQ